MSSQHFQCIIYYNHKDEHGKLLGFFQALHSMKNELWNVAGVKFEKPLHYNPKTDPKFPQLPVMILDGVSPMYGYENIISTLRGRCIDCVANDTEQFHRNNIQKEISDAKSKREDPTDGDKIEAEIKKEQEEFIRAREKTTHQIHRDVEAPPTSTNKTTTNDETNETTVQPVRQNNVSNSNEEKIQYDSKEEEDDVRLAAKHYHTSGDM